MTGETRTMPGAAPPTAAEEKAATDAFAENTGETTAAAHAAEQDGVSANAALASKSETPHASQSAQLDRPPSSAPQRSNQLAQAKSWQEAQIATEREERRREKLTMAIGAAVGIALVAGFVLMLSNVIDLTAVTKEPPRSPKSLEQPRPAVTALSLDREEKLKAREEFRDCERCPLMVVIPAGEFFMGPSADEISEGKADDDEKPQHKVVIARKFAVGKFETTFSEWDLCVEEGGCRGYRPSSGGASRGSSPVYNVSWHDAKLYVRWLSGKTGKEYRLLSEAEWEYAARAGSTTRFFFGDDSQSVCSYANVADESGSANRRGSSGFSSWVLCDDGWPEVAPVGRFKPNQFGLYDILGNVWEWVEDAWHKGYSGAPADGSAWITDGDQNMRVVRGGAFNVLPGGVRSAYRMKSPAPSQVNVIGFRVARTLPSGGG